MTHGPTRLKHVATVRFGFPFDAGRFNESSGVPVIRIRDLEDQSPSTLTDELAPEWARVTNGDVLIGMDGEFRAAVWDGPPSWLNQRVCAIDPKPGIDARFLAYAVQRPLTDIEAVKYSTTVKHLSAGDVLNLPIAAPSSETQRRIADFLDAETTAIGASVDQRTRQASLLIERRRAVMFAAVSGRLGDESPRKSSDVPWLSTLPEHWSEIKLTRVARLGSGHTPSRSRPDWWIDGDIPWITTGEVAQIRDDRREVLVHTRECISETGLANSAAELRPPGTVVLCRTAASAGYSALMGTEMATSQDFATWTCGERLLPRFLLFCLRAMRSDLLGRLAMGSTHRTIYFPDIESIRIPLPPGGEQKRMLDLADAQLRPLEPLECAIDRQIALLRERRQAIITAAVTGKLQIPDMTTANAAE